MVLDLKAKIIIVLGILLVIGTFFTLWRISAIKLNNTQTQLAEVSLKLDTVNKENIRLVEYNKQRDNQIKRLEKSYQQKLSAIPADLCGDMKPSVEMLEFFRKGE